MQATATESQSVTTLKTADLGTIFVVSHAYIPDGKSRRIADIMPPVTITSAAPIRLKCCEHVRRPVGGPLRGNENENNLSRRTPRHTNEPVVTQLNAAQLVRAHVDAHRVETLGNEWTMQRGSAKSSEMHLSIDFWVNCMTRKKTAQDVQHASAEHSTMGANGD
jgi:hypothetical protein